MRRVVFDSNAVDPIIDEPGAYEVVRAAVDEKRIEILFTHVTVEELAETPDLERRCRLLVALIELGRLVASGAFILDESRLGHARLSSEEAAPTIEALRSNRPKHSRDALIAVTADTEQCVLVTNEDRLTRRARECGIEVITTLDLLGELRRR